MVLGLEMSVEDLQGRGVEVHRNTWDALEELRRVPR